MPADERRAGGVYYTPADVARGLVRVAVDGLDLRPAPAADGLRPGLRGRRAAAGRGRTARGGRPRPGDDRRGPDLGRRHRRRGGGRRPPVAGGVGRRAGRVGRSPATSCGPTASVADGPWPTPPAGGFDLVVGNPPFQSQLAAPTARDADRAAAAARRGSARWPRPTPTRRRCSSCSAASWPAPGGRVAMIQPESVLSARDAGPARPGARRGPRSIGLWWAGEPVFDAGVRVCAPVLEVAGGTRRSQRPRAAVVGPRRSTPVARSSIRPRSAIGELVEPAAGRRCTGTPAVDLGDGATARPRLADRVGRLPRRVLRGRAPRRSRPPTAGRRRRHDGRDPAGHQRADRPAALPVGVDADPVRPDELGSAGRSTSTGCAPTTRAWPRGREQRLVPKVVLATQTRVLEAAVDVDGIWWPSVPDDRRGAADSGDPATCGASPPCCSAPAATRVGAATGSAARPCRATRSSCRPARCSSLPLPVDAPAWDGGRRRAPRPHDGRRARRRSSGWDAALDRARRGHGRRLRRRARRRRRGGAAACPVWR